MFITRLARVARVFMFTIGATSSIVPLIFKEKAARMVDFVDLGMVMEARVTFRLEAMAN